MLTSAPMKTDLRTDDAIRHFLTTTNLARALGISHSAVSGWGEMVPEGRAFELEVITGGALKAQSWRAKKPATIEAA